MRFRTLEIRWHDSKPISTCDFQPVSFKKARPSAGQEKNFASHSYKLATGGEDNHVRVWMVHPNIRPSTIIDPESEPMTNSPRSPRVEYLATLSRHSAAVNVVRFSPSGELIASAGDDGMIIIWAPSINPQASTYGSDLSQEDLQHEKEYWKPRTTFRCTTMQVYDLAWSPTGEYIIAGSTDNTARVFHTADGKCVHEIAEHTHYVQGVAWDPLNEYIATQSSDRSMHIYRISTKQGTFEAHAVGKNSRMPHRHSRTPSAQGHSSSRPRMFRSQSIASDAESIASDYPKEKDETPGSTHGKDMAPLTPATSVASSSSAMFPPPPIDNPSSRRSSFSGSNAPSSPSTFARYGRSPSPMPPLPAIRSLPSPAAAWATVKLYGDESFTNFFRRLSFSPDGGLLLTPAGQFEDPSVIPGSSNGKEDNGTPIRGRKGRASINNIAEVMSPAPASSSSSVYIYSRANFARPPIAQLPGHKKASVAVKFSPVLYELRPTVEGDAPLLPSSQDPKMEVLEKGVEGMVDVDVVGPMVGGRGVGSLVTPQRTPLQPFSQSTPSIAAPSPVPASSTSWINSSMASPATSPMDLRPPTPSASKPPTPNQGLQTPARNAVFALPYRMLFAVVTMDTVAIYDTQQTAPVCLLTNLHYDEFTDTTWSPDGQCLILSARDGYCTLIIFDEILPAYHTQQHTLQLQSIAHHHSLPIWDSSSTSTVPHHNASNTGTPAVTPTTTNVNLPFISTPVVPKKRGGEPPLTPAASVDGGEQSYFSSSSAAATHLASQPGGGYDKEDERDNIQEPPKKKRRVALTKVGDLGS